MQGIDFWRLADDLSVLQAALLICGIDPSGKEYAVERLVEKPEGYEAIKHALITSLQNGDLEGREIRHTDPQYGDEYVNVNETLIKVASIKDWLLEKGIQRHFFFFPNEPEGEFLSEAHPRYSPKLAAAVRAWQALDDEDLHEKTPKQSAIVWLRKHSAQYDLQDKDGKLKEGAIEEIAKIINWSPKGGAPSTPFGTGSDEPMTASSDKNTGIETFAVLEERKIKNEVFDDSSLGIDIPF